MEKIKSLLNKSSTLKYWVFVIGKPAFWDALPISKLGDRILDILLSLIVAAVFLAAYGKIIDPSLQLGFNIATILLWFGSIFILRFVAALIHLPAKTYEKLGGLIENPFEISTLYGNFSNEETKWLTIKIANRSKLGNIENCFVQLVNIQDPIDNKPISFDSQRLEWSGRETDMPAVAVKKRLTLFSNDCRWCDVAWAFPKENKAYYKTWYAGINERTEIKEGKHRIVIKAHGTLHGQPIDFPFMIDFTYRLDTEDGFTIEEIREINEAR